MTKTRRKALWRQVEDMTVKERIESFGVGKELWAEPIAENAMEGTALQLGYEKIGDVPLNELHSYVDICDWWIVPHTPFWVKVRASWMQSKVWKEFSKAFRAEHPDCALCGAPCFCTHHRGRHTLDHTVIWHGFLEALEHPEYFETLCSDCHYKGHRQMIESERAR